MSDTNIGKLSKKKEQKIKEVTNLKTEELNENAKERKCTKTVNMIFSSNSTFHLFPFHSFLIFFNSLTPVSDQDRVSPNYI